MPRFVITAIVGALFSLAPTPAPSQDANSTSPDDILIADFEDETYGPWQAVGSAFGSGPARGTLPGQMEVTGFQGQGLVNSFVGGDGSTGTLTSPPFVIQRPYINFLIGGGGYQRETCIDLLVQDELVRTATGPNTSPGGSEALAAACWDVHDLVGKRAVIRVVDQRKGGWGHINVDMIAQSNTAAAAPWKPVVLVTLQKTLRVDGTHLIVPVANAANRANALRLGIFDGQTLVQNFNVTLPDQDDAYWWAAYPLTHFGLAGKAITVRPVDRDRVAQSCKSGFDRIRVGRASEVLSPEDFRHPYRNQFHVASRRGWNNDPNGMVYHDGKYHLFYQHNPLGITWGNMHWGHFESTDLIHWRERPIALFQKTVSDMAFSGSGFVDTGGTAGLGKNVLMVAYTSTGRGECLAYSHDGGLSFRQFDDNPVVTHKGRDPKVIWYQPQQKWVMAVYNNQRCAETDAIPASKESEGRKWANIAFWHSEDLHDWTRTGAFTDADRNAVFECPELFPLPIQGQPGQSRWILYAAQNRYFVGHFDGQRFEKESGPHGDGHGAFYAAQTFNHVPDDRRIQIGWVRTASYQQRFPDQIVNQALTLPHELTLRQTEDGLRVFFWPVKETEKLRAEVLAEGRDLSIAKANKLLASCRGQLSEVQIRFAAAGPKQLVINGIDAHFDGQSARIFTDRTFNEVYAGSGAFYAVRTRQPQDFDSQDTQLVGEDGQRVLELKIYRLKSIWPQ